MNRVNLCFSGCVSWCRVKRRDGRRGKVFGGPLVQQQQKQKEQPPPHQTRVCPPRDGGRSKRREGASNCGPLRFRAGEMNREVTMEDRGCFVRRTLADFSLALNFNPTYDRESVQEMLIVHKSQVVYDLCEMGVEREYPSSPDDGRVWL